MPFRAANTSSMVGTCTVVTRPMPLRKRSCLISASVRFLTSPFPLVVRSTFLSCISTKWPSFVMCKSISTISTPIATQFSIAGMEFSGALRQSPRCDTTSTRCAFGLLSASKANPNSPSAQAKFTHTTAKSSPIKILFIIKKITFINKPKSPISPNDRFGIKKSPQIYQFPPPSPKKQRQNQIYKSL